MTGFADTAKWLSSVFDVSGSAAAAPPALVPVSPVKASPEVTVDATEKAFQVLMALREGDKHVVYLDSEGLPTVGEGHLVVAEDHLRLGDTITAAQDAAFFHKDGAGALKAAREQAAEAGITDESFIPYLGSVCYQLGLHWTNKFPNTWDMICDGKYAAAALALRGTTWAKQTPTRVTDFQDALKRLPAKGSQA